MDLPGISLARGHPDTDPSVRIHGRLYRESSGFKIRAQSAQPRATWRAGLRASTHGGGFEALGEESGQHILGAGRDGQQIGLILGRGDVAGCWPGWTPGPVRYSSRVPSASARARACESPHRAGAAARLRGALDRAGAVTRWRASWQSRHSTSVVPGVRAPEIALRGSASPSRKPLRRNAYPIPLSSRIKTRSSSSASAGMNSGRLKSECSLKSGCTVTETPARA